MSESSGQGLTLIAPLAEADQSDITIDIVAVPGLASDPTRSFGPGSSGKGFDWLRDPKDGVRSDVPTARVMLYEYDSRWLGGKAVPQTLHNAASLFLDSLIFHRKGYETRPLVFLAHSMGGLLVAKALTIAVSRPEEIDRMRIYECFAGAIFFGTPFRGTSAVAKAFLLATFLEQFGKAIPSQMLQFLDPARDSLVELRNDFAQLATKEPAANIACIYELEKQDYMREKFGQWLPKNVGPSEIVVSEASATLDFANEVRGMACNHRNLNRFDGPKNGRYESVRLLLKSITSKARLVVKRRLAASTHSVVDDATFAKISESLNTVDFRRKRRNIESVSGNSSWILEEPKYLQWSSAASDPSDSRCLWVSGSEGQGKSKAALSVVEAIEEEEKNNQNSGARNVLAAYFFCDSTPDSRSAENVLKSLIWQLILKRRSLAQYVKGFAAQEKSRAMNSQDSISLSKLWTGLREMVRDPSVQEVYLVVNNLHYLSNDEKSTQDFLTLLETEALAHDDGIEDPIRDKVRWMFLSRARDNIKSTLMSEDAVSALRVDLEDGSKNSQLREALKTYTRDRVKTLATYKNYSLALQYFVNSILQKRAENNTLWVEVVCRLLEGIPSNHVQVRRTLEALPQDLQELINRTWAEALTVNSEETNTTKEILRTLSVVYEDPTIDELKVLAELDPDADATNVREQIRACGPLLRVYDASEFTEDDLGSYRVTFIHPLAKDALLGEKRSRTLIGLSEDDDDEHTEVKWQHGIVALRCFSYTLGRVETDEGSMVWERAGASNNKEEQAEKELDDLFPDTQEEEEEDEEEVNALEYPLKYWLRHGNEATADFVETLDLKHAFWAVDSVARRRWWNKFAEDDYEELEGLTSMHVAAFFGSTPLIKSLIADGHKDEIHVRDNWDNQPLHWAASQGHVAAMEKLLSEGADINNGHEDHVWTPLHMATSGGQLDAMKFLLSGNFGEVNLNAVAKEDGTALTLALTWNQKQAAELLLEAGASPILTAEDADSPVAAAALRGFDDIVKSLIDLGVGENIVSQEYGTALAAAASAGHEGIVRTLLEIDHSPESHQRALLEAAKNDFHLIVRFLLENTEELRCDEAFDAAAPLGNDLVLQELWSHHTANGTLSQDAIDNALYTATDNEQESTVKFLLEQCHANPNVGGKEQGNAVTAAAYDANIDILNMLMGASADLHSETGYPLHAAASEGHEDVVALLLSHGAPANAFCTLFPDGMALQAACVAGHIGVARALLNAGADPNIGAGTYTNPLTAATSNGHGDLAELLLQHRANPNVFGGEDGSTPLINAAATLAAKYLGTLIQYGANVNMLDPDEDTALIVSALLGDEDCVDLLIKHGANVNYCGKHNGTALQAAASNGYSTICRTLLSHGADPTIRGGPHGTALQAAASSGDKDCVKLILGEDPENATGAQKMKFWKSKIDVNVRGGTNFTALHAAATQSDDGGLRLLLERKPQLNVSSPPGPKSGTALQSAILVGCNRNARLLLEAGADPNIVAGKYSALQVAALKGSRDLCELLLEKGAKIEGWSGKYGSPLVAAVVCDYHSDGDTEVLELLLEKDFDAQAYRAALETAFRLQRKEAFKLIWKSAQAKGPKKLPLSTKQLLTHFKNIARKRRPADLEHEDANSDFGDDIEDNYQDIEDEEVEEEEEDEEVAAISEQTRQLNLGSGSTRSVGQQGPSSRGLGQPDGQPYGSGMGRFSEQANASGETSRGFGDGASTGSRTQGFAMPTTQFGGEEDLGGQNVSDQPDNEGHDRQVIGEDGQQDAGQGDEGEDSDNQDDGDQDNGDEDDGNHDDGDGDDGDGDDGDGDDGDGNDGDGDEGDEDEGEGDEADGDEGDGDEGDADEGDGDEGDGDEDDGDEGEGDDGDDGDEGDEDEDDEDEGDED